MAFTERFTSFVQKRTDSISQQRRNLAHKRAYSQDSAESIDTDKVAKRSRQYPNEIHVLSDENEPDTIRSGTGTESNPVTLCEWTTGNSPILLLSDIEDDASDSDSDDDGGLPPDEIDEGHDNTMDHAEGYHTDSERSISSNEDSSRTSRSTRGSSTVSVEAEIEDDDSAPDSPVVASTDEQPIDYTALSAGDNSETMSQESTVTRSSSQHESRSPIRLFPRVSIPRSETTQSTSLRSPFMLRTPRESVSSSDTTKSTPNRSFATPSPIKSNITEHSGRNRTKTSSSRRCYNIVQLSEDTKRSYAHVLKMRKRLEIPETDSKEASKTQSRQEIQPSQETLFAKDPSTPGSSQDTMYSQSQAVPESPQEEPRLCDVPEDMRTLLISCAQQAQEQTQLELTARERYVHERENCRAFTMYKKILFYYAYGPVMGLYLEKIIRNIESEARKSAEDQNDSCWIYKGSRCSRNNIPAIIQFCHEGSRLRLTLNFGAVNMLHNGRLTAEAKRGFIQHNFHTSHLCGNWRCINLDHIVAEASFTNLTRNRCLRPGNMRTRPICSHDPPCLTHLTLPILPEDRYTKKVKPLAEEVLEESE